MHRVEASSCASQGGTGLCPTVFESMRLVCAVRASAGPRGSSRHCGTVQSRVASCARNTGSTGVLYIRVCTGSTGVAHLQGNGNSTAVYRHTPDRTKPRVNVSRCPNKCDVREVCTMQYPLYVYRVQLRFKYRASETRRPWADARARTPRQVTPHVGIVS